MMATKGKKKILIVLTGGTICSVFNGKVKEAGDQAKTILEESFLNSYSPYANDVTFVSTKNYKIFSENMTVDIWNTFIKDFRKMPEFRDTAIAHGNYPSLENCKIDKEENVLDGIIIAHGTDTLAYSSSLFSILLKELGVPVFFVSSNEALSADRANGKDNFAAAVECICMGIKPNVYVTYKNICDDRMYLHYGSRLEQCANYKEDFYSAGMVDITDITPSDAYTFFAKLPAAHPDLAFKDEKGNEKVVDLFDDWELYRSVLRVEPYVGLDYSFFNYKNVSAILHGTYHSGTVCSGHFDEEKEDEKNAPDAISALIQASGDVPIYIAPSDVSGVVYDTVNKVCSEKKEKIAFVNGYTTEMLYAKLLVATACPALKADVTSFLSTEYNHELVTQVKDNPQILSFAKSKQ